MIGYQWGGYYGRKIEKWQGGKLFLRSNIFFGRLGMLYGRILEMAVESRKDRVSDS